MNDWPIQIPCDLQVGFESNRTDLWRMTFRKWATQHSLELKVQWFRGLEITMAELHNRRINATPAEHWHFIRLWLKLHDVLPPDRSPVSQTQDAMNEQQN